MKYATVLPESLIWALRQHSEATGVPAARIVRKALELHLGVKTASELLPSRCPLHPDYEPVKSANRWFCSKSACPRELRAPRA